jgi:hypothetical protein
MTIKTSGTIIKIPSCCINMISRIDQTAFRVADGTNYLNGDHLRVCYIAIDGGGDDYLGMADSVPIPPIPWPAWIYGNAYFYCSEVLIVPPNHYYMFNIFTNPLLWWWEIDYNCHK